MSSPSLSIQSTRVLFSSCAAFTRPSDIVDPFNPIVDVTVDVSEFDEPGHFSAIMVLSVQGVGAEDRVHFSVEVSLEALGVVTNVTADEAREIFHYSAASALYGQARVLVSQATASLGLWPIVLPPVDASFIAKIPTAKDKEEA